MCDTSCLSCERLTTKVLELENKLKRLEGNELDEKGQKRNSTKKNKFNKCPLNNEEIERYSRQIILPEISVSGQLMLTKSSVLIVGAGGLGCPASQYLAAAGIGIIGIVDYDVVDLSNLHRQIIHTEDSIGMKKVESIAKSLRKLNSGITIEAHAVSLTSANTMSIMEKYDIVLDCTDNVATRYLLNDACVFLKKTMVSGSALRFEGQLTVYNYADGPCYRCLYPTPPPAETVTNCSDGGVLGAVTGVIGSLQAMEAIKIITENEVSYSGKLLLYDGLNGSFRSIKLRGKKDSCVVCSAHPSITTLQDYELFCGTKASDKETKLLILPKEQRIAAWEYNKLSSTNIPHLLVDVRPVAEYEICSLENSINIPINDLLAGKNIEKLAAAFSNDVQVFIVCKRGNDSQKAVSHIIKSFGHTHGNKVKDIIGGLHAWKREIDIDLPYY